jgi:hypothetical protein
MMAVRESAMAEEAAIGLQTNGPGAGTGRRGEVVTLHAGSVTAARDDGSAARAVARVMEAFPAWLVLWGAYSRQFWAYRERPRHPASRDLVRPGHGRSHRRHTGPVTQRR